MRKQIIDQALAEIAREEANSAEIARVTVGAVRALHAELAALIGSQAASALYARSIHLARLSFPWLSQTATVPLSARLTSLQSDLSARNTSEARQGGKGLLLTFTDLLVTLIGEPLTNRLLRSAWALPADNEPLGSKPDE